MRRIFPLLVLFLAGCAFDFSETKESAAAAKAEQLLVYGKTWSARNEQKLEKIDALAAYAEDGERAVIDPWGQTFQFCYVTEPETQKERLVIWTAEPQTGRVIAAPRQLAPLIEQPK